MQVVSLHFFCVLLKPDLLTLLYSSQHQYSKKSTLTAQYPQ